MKHLNFVQGNIKKTNLLTNAFSYCIFANAKKTRHFRVFEPFCERMLLVDSFLRHALSECMFHHNKD